MTSKTAAPRLLLARLQGAASRVARAVAPKRLRLTLWRVATASALLSLAGFDGCEVIRDDAILTLSIDEGPRNRTVEVLVTLAPPGPSFVGVRKSFMDVTDSPDRDPIGDGPPPPGVMVATVPVQDGARVTLTIRPEAALGPIYFRAAYLDRFPGAPTYTWAIRPFNISDKAPRVGAAVPSTGRRDSPPFEVEIPASNIVEPVRVRAGQLGMEFSGTTYDAGAGSVRTTLRITPDARTGATWLKVVNGDDSSSLRIPFTVTDGPLRPVITSFFPNYAHPGETLPCLVGGSNFTPGTELNDVGPAGATLGTVSVRDSHLLATSLAVAPDPSLTFVEFVAKALSPDPSDPARVRIVPPGTPGPRITRIVPDELVANTTWAQVRIEGENLPSLDPRQIIAVSSDQVVVEPFFDFEARLLRGSTAHAGFVIAELQIEGDPDLTGGIHLAVRNDAGLVSNAVPMQILERIPSRSPILNSAVIGQILRGTVVDETIRGENLHDVERVYFESFGVAAASRVVVDPSGNSLTVTLGARLNATLTGDGATNLYAVTRRGLQSNRLSYSVVDSDHDCDEFSFGVNLIVAVPNGNDRSVFGFSATPDPPVPGSPETRVSVCGVDGCFTIGIALALAHIQVDPWAPVVSMLYLDNAGPTFGKSGGTVKVIAAESNRVVLCINAVLSGGSLGNATVSGHLEFTR